MGTCTICESSNAPTINHKIITVYKKIEITGGDANYTKYRTTFSAKRTHDYPVCENCLAEAAEAAQRGKRRIPLFAIGATMLILLPLALLSLRTMGEEATEHPMIWVTLLCLIPFLLPLFWLIGRVLLFLRPRNRINRLLRSRAVQERFAALGDEERRELRRRRILHGGMEAFIGYTPEEFDTLMKNTNWDTQ